MKPNLLFFITLLTGFFALGFDLNEAKAADISVWNGCDMYFCYLTKGPDDGKVILNEKQARKIIEDEAKNFGVYFDLHDINVEPPSSMGSGVMIPYYPSSVFGNDKVFFMDYELIQEQNAARNIKVQQRLSYVFDEIDSTHHSYVFDEIDSTHQIICEYVQDEPGAWRFSAPINQARSLVEELRNEDTIYTYGIFTSCDEETLRFQVRYFFAWYKDWFFLRRMMD